MFLRCFFVCCVFGFSQVAGETPIYALLGKEAFLKTAISVLPDEILWKHNGNEVVEFNGYTEEQFGSYKDRVSVDWLSADLTISDVRFEDSGQYELETFTGQKLQRTQYSLEVIDKVTKPTISCEMMKGNGSDDLGHKATLTCSAESKQSQSLLKFNWTPNVNGQLGPKLIIPLGNEHDNEEYSCIVSNPLTEESATFSTKKCYPDQKPLIPMIVGICVSVIVNVIIVVICILCRKGYFKCEKTYDLENQKHREVMEDTSSVGNVGVETKCLLDRTPTLPSNHRLCQAPVFTDPVITELRASFHRRPSAEKKNQDPITSPSSPAPETPPESQGLPAEDEDQADEDERGETVEEPLVPADSGEMNDAGLKKGSEKIILSPFAPEKPPRQNSLELTKVDKPREAVEEASSDELDNHRNREDLEKKISKRNSNPPPVPKKTASVKAYKTKTNESRPPEETKENSDEKEKVTASEPSLPPPSLVPETTVLKSPVPESPVPETTVLKSPVPQSPDPKTTVLKSPVPQSPDPETIVLKSPVPESPDPEMPVFKSSVKKSPVPLPRSRLSQAFAQNEQKEDPSSDQVGKPEIESSEESGLLGSRQESKTFSTINSKTTGTVTAHEQQPSVTETKQREETLQENDKQVPKENQKPDGDGDQEEIDPALDPLQEPQRLELSKPDNSKADISPKSPDASQAVPNHKKQDKTRHSSQSETGPEKEDKSETAEGKSESVLTQETKT